MIVVILEIPFEWKKMFFHRCGLDDYQEEVDVWICSSLEIE